jgi:hypothetical protein
MNLGCPHSQRLHNAGERTSDKLKREAETMIPQAELLGGEWEGKSRA